MHSWAAGGVLAFVWLHFLQEAEAASAIVLFFLQLPA